MEKQNNKSDENTFTVNIDGTDVLGKIIYRSASDIDVTILGPYKNLTTGLHIPYFAMHLHNFNGIYGIETAKCLLIRLYRTAQFIDKNLDKIEPEYRKYMNEVDALEQTKFIENAQEKKRILKRFLKNGTINNKEYQPKLMKIKKDVDDIAWKIRCIWDDFFEQNFQEIVPYGDRDDVLKMILDRMKKEA